VNQRREILEKVKSVVSLPPTATKIVQLVQKEDVKIAELTSLIEFDPGLTTNMLRLANSAEIGGLKEINSIRNAVVRLGMKRIFQLVMLSTVSPIAQKPVRGYGLPAGELWEHSIAVAIGVGNLAKALKIKLPDSVFTAGLLHDIGKLVLGTFVEVDENPIMELAYNDKIPFNEAEEKVLGISHTEVGAVLLENWRLPSEIVNVTRWHHNVENFKGNTIAVDLVHIVDSISIMFGIGVRRDGLNYRQSQDVMSRLSINNKIIESVACETMSSIEEVRKLFETNGKKGTNV
jgi:putative nucleotidyltransferase with HDIG domain